MNKQAEKYMRRCFDLAYLGAGTVAPNPMVGAVLVHEERIIGEGFHRRYGGAHAEVEAVRSVSPADRPKISESTLYVSLEPCCVFGKTPPCTDLIIREKIPRVVISALDRTPGVDGEGVKKLRAAGIDVITGVLKRKGAHLSRIRNTFAGKERPYIILKYASSADGFIGQPGLSIWLTNSFSKRLVHKWRNECDAILVGTNTALTDNPRLTNRLYFGKSPLRIVIDRHNRLPNDLHLLDDATPTWVFANAIPEQAESFQQTRWLQINKDEDWIYPMMRSLVKAGHSSLLVEGGSKILTSFVAKGWWDEARVLVSPDYLHYGLQPPALGRPPSEIRTLGNDKLLIFYASSSHSLNND